MLLNNRAHFLNNYILIMKQFQTFLFVLVYKKVAYNDLIKFLKLHIVAKHAKTRSFHILDPLVT